MGFKRPLFGQPPSGIVIDEQVELADRFRNCHKAEALVAQGRPAGDAEQLHCRERRFATFGKAESTATWESKAHCAGTETSQRALGLVEPGKAVAVWIQKRAMERQNTGIVAYCGNQRRQESHRALGSERHARMEAQIGR